MIYPFPIIELIGCKKQRRAEKIIFSILVILLISIFTWGAEAKSIKKDAITYAEDYFSLNLARNLFRGADISAALGKMSRSDFRFLGEGQQNGVNQSGYLSLQPDFLMVTISRNAGSRDILSVNVTRIDTDVPFSKIKYLAFDSRTDGKGKNKVKTLYMGEGSINGIPIKHLLQETSHFTQGDYKQVTWMYAVNNR